MDLLILGAGGHGHVVKEVAEATGRYKRIAFLDDSVDGINNGDGTSSQGVGGIDIIGKLSDYEKYITSFSHAFVAIGNPTIRNQWQVRLATAGYQIPILIHSDAYVSPSAAVDIGTVIMPKAVVQSNVKIGKGCIISAGAIVDHDAVVDEYCHVNAGAVVAAGSVVGYGTKIDHGAVWRGASQAPVADRELEDMHKKGIGTDISFF